jgi:hypothetical protein
MNHEGIVWTDLVRLEQDHGLGSRSAPAEKRILQRKHAVLGSWHEPTAWTFHYFKPPTSGSN